MRLFRRSPPEGEVVRTTATIERVAIASADDDDERSVTDNVRVFLTFALGADFYMQEEFRLASGSIPFPGSTVDVAYGPDRIDFNPRSVRPPDPGVPRGWGAGVLEVPNLGGERSWAVIARYEMARQRDLFRTGRRYTAEIFQVQPLRKERRGARLYRLTLSNPGREALEPKVWLPDAYVPSPDDRIQVAVGRDGSVALDSDERFDGAPLQALVVNPPAPVEPPPEPVPDLLDRQLESLRATRHFNVDAYEQAVRTLLDQMRASGRISEAEYQHRLKEALS